MLERTRAAAGGALTIAKDGYLWTVDKIERHPHWTFWVGLPRSYSCCACERSMTMAISYEALQDELGRLWRTMSVRPEKLAVADRIARKILANRERTARSSRKRTCRGS